MVASGFSKNNLFTLTTDELLHPERFSLAQLKQIVESRGGACEELSTMDDIIKLYNDLVLPKPQRKYDLNTRLGRRLQESQSRLIRLNQNEISMDVDLQSGNQFEQEEIKTKSHNESTRIETHRRPGIQTARAPDAEEPANKKRIVRNEIKWP